MLLDSSRLPSQPPMSPMTPVIHVSSTCHVPPLPHVACHVPGVMSVTVHVSHVSHALFSDPRVPLPQRKYLLRKRYCEDQFQFETKNPCALYVVAHMMLLFFKKQNTHLVDHEFILKLRSFLVMFMWNFRPSKSN